MHYYYYFLKTTGSVSWNIEKQRQYQHLPYMFPTCLCKFRRVFNFSSKSISGFVNRSPSCHIRPSQNAIATGVPLARTTPPEKYHAGEHLPTAIQEQQPSGWDCYQESFHKMTLYAVWLNVSIVKMCEVAKVCQSFSVGSNYKPLYFLFSQSIL